MLLIFIYSLLLQEVSNLEVINSFPQEDGDYYFDFTTQIEKFSESTFLLCDQAGDQILIISKKGEFLGRLGKSGNGPGEFSNPLGFSLYSDKVFVLDQNNRRIHCLETSGVYQFDFKLLEFPSSFIATRDYLYGSVNLPIVEKDTLITKLTYSGAVESRFGKRLFLEKNVTPKTSANFLRIYNNKLYVLFKYYPIVQSYQLSTHEEKIIKFRENVYSTRVPENYLWSDLTVNQRTLRMKYLFRAFRVTDYGFYVGLMDKDLLIDQISFDGSLLKRYAIRYPEEIGFYMYDMIVDDSNKNSPIFYVVCRKDGENTIDICQIAGAER